MKIAYTDKLRLSKDNVQKLTTINAIVDEYLDDGFVMTLRQLYYQLVSRDIISNNQKEYAKLSKLLTTGRMAGIVDWDAIEDRGRRPKLPYWVRDIANALNDTHEQYRLNRMRDQDHYIEVWVEKDALSNVLYRVTEKYHINLMVNKGYSSASAMHESYRRFKYQYSKNHKLPVLLYFGDHDPSGKDMVRDITDRLHEFGLKDVIVENPALTMAQINEYDLPENPAKISDPRAQWYIGLYGEHSWELDALEPPVLIDIVEQSVLRYVDEEKYEALLALEEKHKERLQEISDQEATREEDEDDNEEEDE